MTKFQFDIGDKLANGHHVVAFYNGPRGAFVLARSPLPDAPGLIHPYATWRIALDGSTYHGNYYATAAEAWADFHDRTGIAQTVKAVKAA